MKAIRFSQHHVLMLITLVYLFSNQVQAMPTTEPISPVLQALAPSIDDHSVVLVWHAPEDTSAIADYQILQNGRPIGLASQNNDQHSPAKPYI
ncbi:exo-poly-alpha-D-galacturonosidase, partial [Pectobacterium versatile]|nr:exo-poly-alpha-D-galacturonosidase [Pectobacterium versatile]